MSRWMLKVKSKKQVPMKAHLGGPSCMLTSAVLELRLRLLAIWLPAVRGNPSPLQL